MDRWLVSSANRQNCLQRRRHRAREDGYEAGLRDQERRRQRHGVEGAGDGDVSGGKHIGESARVKVVVASFTQPWAEYGELQRPS